MAVVVLPLPEGPVSATMRRSRPPDRIADAAEDTLSWNTSSQRRTNCVSLFMAWLIVSKSIIRISPLLSRGKVTEISSGIIPRYAHYVKGAIR